MMSSVKFVKMQGAGNDFIMIDNRQGRFSEEMKSSMAARFCPRALAVGADGMIFLEEDDECDARWGFYNADGSLAEMCGNGARCFTLYARSLGVFEEVFSFRTLAGVITAEITGVNSARVRLTDAPRVEKITGMCFADKTEDVFFINTGVPHAVIGVDDIDVVDVVKYGSVLRYHERFAPAGTNVNFISMCDSGIAIRTYERGVEAETLACGTGSVAGAIVAGEVFGLVSPVDVLTRSGDVLRVFYKNIGNGSTDVYLEGPAREIYRGELEL